MNYADVGLRQSEYDDLCRRLGREPNDLELRIMGVMWSEHCSYKSTRPLLKTLPVTGPKVVMGPGENAGVIDGGDGWGIAFKVESHNHPSAVAPLQGAATGVGGIIRDVLAMGARPVASLDGLFFGSPESSVHDGVVKGVGSYGNCIGVPTIGGMTAYDPCYEGNPLVNAMNIGVVKLSSLVSSQKARPGQSVVLLGSRTGRDGIAGAAFASAELKDDSASSRPSIQIGDPFEEKLLVEACLEMRDAGLFVSVQDMGAAGILSSSSEVAAKSGVGMTVDFSAVPLRSPDMEPWEIALSETQERMLLVVEDDKLDDVFAIASRWGLGAAVIGRTEEGDSYRILWNGHVVADVPASTIGSDCPVIDWPAERPDLESRWQSREFSIPSGAEALLALLADPAVRSRDAIYVQYDSMVQTNTVVGPGSPVSVFRIEGTDRLAAVSMEADPWACWLDPQRGTERLTAKSCRDLAVAGAEPAGLTNCLNFPSPEKPENFWTLSECVRGLGNACRELNCPVVSGNVSLYNETSRGGILPTPLVGTVGLIPDARGLLRSGRWQEGDVIFLAGWLNGSLAGSLAQRIWGEGPAGRPEAVDFGRERTFERAARAAARSGLAHSGRALSRGGLAVALAKESAASALGAWLDAGSLTEPQLYGEGACAAVYAVRSENAEAFAALWGDVPLALLGTAGGKTLSMSGAFHVPTETLRRSWEA